MLLWILRWSNPIVVGQLLCVAEYTNPLKLGMIELLLTVLPLGASRPNEPLVMLFSTTGEIRNAPVLPVEAVL